MSSAGPARREDSLADVVEMLLDKGVVVNADIVVSIGDTELLGVQLRAAIASFETAAEYGLEFPDGTDMRRVEEASGRSELPEEDEESDTIQTAIAETGEEGPEPDDEDGTRSEPGRRDRQTGVSDGDEDSDDEQRETAEETTDDTD